MDSMTTGYRDRRSPSSDQFLSFFSFSPPSSSTITTTDELVEAEIFWTEDFTEPNHNKGQNQNHNHSDSTIPKSFTPHYNQKNNRRLSFGFTHSLNSGILAVLPESDKGSQDLCRNTSITSTSSQLIPMIPRPAHCQSSEYSQSVLSRKFQQSAPMNVPVLSQAMAKRRNGDLFYVIDGEDDGNYEILPPHELVTRGSGVSPKTTFSVLDGVGRTLKGRDLRQVRNAIWRKTGFLD